MRLIATSECLHRISILKRPEWLPVARSGLLYAEFMIWIYLLVEWISLSSNCSPWQDSSLPEVLHRWEHLPAKCHYRRVCRSPTLPLWVTCALLSRLITSLSLNSATPPTCAFDSADYSFVFSKIFFPISSLNTYPPPVPPPICTRWGLWFRNNSCPP